MNILIRNCPRGILPTLALPALVGMALLGAACTKAGGLYDEVSASYLDRSSGASSPNGPGGNNQQAEAGVLTAAEWNDLANWDFWCDLLEGEHKEEIARWGFNTSRRIAVRVTAEGTSTPAVGVRVDLLSGSKTIWRARTDNRGEASLWPCIFQQVGQENSDADPSNLRISIDGVTQSSPLTLYDPKDPQTVNTFTLPGWDPSKVDRTLDLAFIVDATGSMGDEIEFLKKDLLSILEEVSQSQGGLSIRTGTVFYRDEGDEYVTRSSPFTEDFSKTISFVKGQNATGGGDIPEAVHTALAEALRLDWAPSAYSSLAFLILDAPAHDEGNIYGSLHSSIEKFAERGIRVIPVFASSGSKSCEFMSRLFAIATGGTYVFLTDDSGVGGEHITPTVGQYQVERLRDILIRLISQAME